VAADKKLDFIALLEINKNSFSTQCLEIFCAGADFVWHWRCPRGISGGMLMGINQEFFEVENIEDGDFHIKFVLKNKVDGLGGPFYLFMVQHKRNTKSSSYQS
jgi:hypothetical protein